MDVKDSRTEPALSERNNDGSKYTQGGVATLQCNRNKSYQDIGSNSLAKAEGVSVRPCAVIGPDRVVLPPTSSDAFLKKVSVEPWPSPDNGYRRPPDYPHRLDQNPARNISPRQTFQENMQRINVPPTYNAVRHSDSANYNHIQDRSVTISKNAKPNMAPEAKYCDVPYAINALGNEPKNVRDSEMYVSSVNPQLTRSAPHVWPPGSVNVNASRTFSANEPYQYQQYTNFAGPRPPVIPMTRPHRAMQEDPAYVYPDHYYRDAVGRLKPYPPIKERCPQPRYEYFGNYGGQFQPPPQIPPLKYDIPKSGQTHPYPVYPHYKYLDNRVPDPAMEGYQRSTSHQPHYNPPYCTQVIHPTYAQVPGNTPQKVQPYAPDGSVKAVPSNKLHYDNTSKMYIDYENARTKPYPMGDNYYVNEMNRFHPLKNQMLLPNYSQVGMHTLPSQQYYLKDNTQMKPFEYMPTFRNFEPHLAGNPGLRHAPQFSPNTLAISPTDSSTSNDTSQTQGTSQEDCGYVSQSSTNSGRSIDSGIYRLPHEYYKRHDFRYGPIVGSQHTMTKTDSNSKDNKQKQINVRQFLQMWNEGEEDSENNNSKDIIIQTGSSEIVKLPNHAHTEDQLYVLGLVNVSNEDLSKYEHIEKISKLPENIKGYNNLELFSRFEEAMESCNTTPFKANHKEFQNSSKDHTTKLIGEVLPRPVSPLDVESKISQSVIHKEVGCNFEIKPCSPKMLNVEVAATAQHILGERVIEKVSNPISKIVKSPLPSKSNETNCHTVIRQDNVFSITDNPSCKMIRSPFSTNTMDSVKTNYTLQDIEINSGVCLASLPQLDNEIELNFPEVNQQFINANKRDEFSSANSYIQSNLQEDSSLPDNKDDKKDSEKVENILPKCDKTFSKLSKYRKSKTSVADSSENSSKAVRTDSVIIKNPENIENKMLENSINIPMNLTSQSTQWYDSPHENKDSDMALDFSLNKCGNDLPIIETEKNTLIKPFQINHSHLSHENVLPTDTSACYQESAYINDNTVNSKTTVQSNKTNLNIISGVQNYQDLKSANVLPNDHATNEKKSYVNDNNVINSKEGIVECIQIDPKISSVVQSNQKVENSYKITKSPVFNNNNTDTLVLETPSESLMHENEELETKNDDTDQHTHNYDDSKINLSKISEITCSEIIYEESQPPIKENNTYENIVKSNGNIENEKDNLKNDLGNLKKIALPPTVNMRNKDVDVNMRLIFTPEEYNEHKIEELITSKNENDFEHDEISASLEKLFRESNEVKSPPTNDNISLEVPQKFKLIVSHQSKELYSPWIQKLLTHSEGSCIYNELSQKSIFGPTKHIDKPDESDIKFLKDKLANDITMDNNELIASYDNKFPITSNNFITKNSKNDLTADFSPKSESIVSNQTTDNVSDSLKKSKKENEPLEKTSEEPRDTIEKEKSCIKKTLHQIINDEKGISQVVIDKSRRKIKKRILHTSKKTKNLSNCDNESLTNVSVNNNLDTNNCKRNNAEKDSELIISTKSICELESIIQKDSTASCSKTVSDYVAANKDKQATEQNGSKQYLPENILTKHYNNTEVFNSNCEYKFNSIVQDDLNESSVENKSSDTPLVEHQIGGNSRKEMVIKSIIDNSNKDTDLMSMTFDSCADDSAVLKNRSDLTSECFSMSVSDILTEHQEHKTFGEAMITNITMNKSADIKGDKMNNSNSSNIDRDDQNVCIKPCDSVLDNYMDHGSDESKILEHLDNVTKLFAKDADKTNGALNVLKKLDLIDDHKNLPDSLSTKNTKSDERLVEKRNIQENTEDESDKSKISNATCNDGGSHENENSCSTKRSILNNFIEGSRNIGSLSENINISDSNRKMSETLDSLEIDRKEINEIIEDSVISSDIFNEQKRLQNSFEDLEKRKDHDITSKTSDISNIVGSKDIYQDQQNLALQVLSTNGSDYSIEHKIQINEGGENISKNFGVGEKEGETNSPTNMSVTKDILLENTEQENLLHLNTLTNNHIKHETKQENIKDCLTANHGIAREDSSFGITKTFECDNVASDNSIFYETSMNANDDQYIVKHESEVGIDEVSFVENKTMLKNNASVMEERNSQYDSQIQENKNDYTLKNLSDYVSNQYIGDYDEQTASSSKVNITATDDQYVSCEDNKNSICDPINENNLTELENNLSVVHNPVTSIQQSAIKKRRLALKRSFSDSALNKLTNRDTPDRQLIDNTPMWPPKRQKVYEINNSQQEVIDENFCNFIQNRRNSISSYYNTENVSFCILIDNDCILTEENAGEKVCFAEVSEDCLNELNTANLEDNVSEVICGPEDNELEFSDSVMLGYDGEKSIQESWLNDVACVETVVSDDIVEDADYDAPDFCRDDEHCSYEESGIFNSDISEITHRVHLVDEEAVQDIVSEIKNTCRTPRNDDKIELYDEEPQFSNNYNVLYSGQCMEKILSESYRRRCSPSPTSDYSESILTPGDAIDPKLPEDKENIYVNNMTLQNYENDSYHDTDTVNNNFSDIDDAGTTSSVQLDNTMHLAQSRASNKFIYKKHDEDSCSRTSSSSPEVSSTTIEEKNSSILLKITTYNGARVSEINEVSRNRPRCKFTESKDYSNSQGSFPKRPLMTKAAQKYIPPLIESIGDLKVKLPLPQQRLLKLKQLKLAKSEPMVAKQNNLSNKITKKPKLKPNFEDVLKNIDEVQIKMHKQNSKKYKNIVPKVVIKKNVNGSHYTSSSDKEKFNPDLTGRKWQPWVFLERNRFIDNMALRNKTKAIFSHRKNMYVLAERFKKYKSVSDCRAKFVISQPKTSDASRGQLKYKIILKHS